MKSKEAVAAIVVIIIAGVSILAIEMNVVQFGGFPERKITDNYEVMLKQYDEGYSENFTDGEIQNIMKNRPHENFGKQSISIEILENFREETHAANAVTAILWDYRGYDTLGEATVIFVAVAAVAALFRTSKEEE